MDLFTLANQVDVYNALFQKTGQPQGQNIVVNLPGSALSQEKVTPEKQILTAAEKTPVLTMRQIITQTNLELDEAEATLKKLADKGLVKEVLDLNGVIKYDFS